VKDEIEKIINLSAQNNVHYTHITSGVWGGICRKKQYRMPHNPA